MHIPTAYEERSEEFHLLLPVRIHRMALPPGTANVFYLHWHREFEFYLLVKGGVIFTIEDREYTVGEGEGVFVSANRLHAARGVGDRPCEFVAVVFSDSVLAEQGSGLHEKYVAPVTGGRLRFPELLAPSVPWQGEVLDRLGEIGRIPAGELKHRELQLKSSLLAIWHSCFDAGEACPEADLLRYRDRLQPVVEYIHEHYMYDLSLEKLAGLLPMSVGQFCRVFKSRMNTTPMAYIMRYRVLQSCRLLGETGRSVTEIANRTGFNNVSYFNKVFLQIIGCTPTRYRREGVATGHILFPGDQTGP